MVLRALNLAKQFYFLKRSVHKQICKMNQAYLRHSDPEKFELTFQFQDSNLRIDRQFNFSRQISEPITSFTQRVGANIEKIVKKKTKKETPVEVSVTLNGAKIEDDEILCRNVFSDPKNEVTLNISDHIFKVIINSPWVNSMTLPTCILAGFPLYPVKFESVHTVKNLTKFDWAKSINKNDWTLVGSGFMYYAKNSDIGAFLKLSCLPKNENVEGPKAEVVSTVQVQAGPGFCPFETRHEFTREKCIGDIFRVVSYNILADLYCDSDFTREVLHPYCPPYALAIDYRKQLFIKEITGYNGDIICLQEVDRKIYNYDLQPIFTDLGYDSDFCIKGGQVAEGVTTFFNRKRFKLLENHRLVISEQLNTNDLFADIWIKIEANEKLKERILDLSSVLQVTVFESLDNGEILIVGNTHLYFHPDADHIRLLQGTVVIRYLENVLKNLKDKFQKRLSLILCGDFNSVPDCGIYQLYTTGEVNEDHVDFQSKPEEAVKISLSQSILLKSACGTPIYTNFTVGFADCLDYIYYQSSHFEVTQVVPFPSYEELTQNTAIPSIVFPSDHIALISDLKWI